MKKATNTIDEVRAEHQNLKAQTNGLIPYICLFQISRNKSQYGVNYLQPNTNKGHQYKAIDGRTPVTVIEPLF